VGSPELREWASAELNGYSDGATAPEYRKVVTGLALDAIVGRTQITGQSVSAAQVSAVLGVEIPQEVWLQQPIAELSRIADSGKDHVQFAPAWGAAFMARVDRSQPFQNTHAVYWNVSTSTIAGIVDRVATKLSTFVAEVRNQMPSPGGVPSAEAVKVATQIVITGGINQFSLGPNSPVQGSVIAVQQGDLAGLKDQLTKLGIESDELDDLVAAMRSDEDDATPGETPGPGSRTRAWVERAATRVGRITGQVGVGAAGGTLGDLLLEALKAYYGQS
jgi:hypothetical protein